MQWHRMWSIARHTGDYASLYQAASDYLDQASDAEKATDTWKAQKQAITDGLVGREGFIWQSAGHRQQQ